VTPSLASSILVSLTLTLALTTTATAQGFVNFESPQVRPIVVSQDGTRLYAVNTADNRLAVYSLAQPTAPVLLKEIPVGFEPTSVSVRTKDEVWVVNHVSDSISVVNVALGAVIDTIQVGDEPGDVVFAGNPQRAFVSAATARLVQVFDPSTRKQVGQVSVFGDDPTALLASADGKTVWVSIHRSGNRTTIVPHTIAPPPPKPTNLSLPPAPAQGIIVDSEDPTWKTKLNVKLPDYDVVEIDTATLKVRKNYSAVGTILFNLTLRPGTSELWVANTESQNKLRFEPRIKAHAIDSRVTRIVMGTTPTITPIDLNPGINYATLPNNQALSTVLSQPTDVVFDPTGKTGYVAAFGTDRIGVIDAQGKVTARIEVGNTSGTTIAPRTKRGPRGLAHHPSQGLLYVLNRLANSISVVDTNQSKVLVEVSMFDMTPKVIREGRGFLYDAKLSGNGTMSCASCHIDGRHDGLPYDLGDPGGQMFSIGTPTKLHPMKGPLMTQTLQGLKGERVLHWRADKVGFKEFNGAFVGLLGKTLLSTADMDDFGKFVDSIVFAPNPNRNLDDTLPSTPVGTSAKDGHSVYTNKLVANSGTFRCQDCHPFPSGAGVFGFAGLTGQQMKAVQLRGLHKKTGRKPSAQGRTSGFGIGSDGSHDDVVSWASTSRFSGLTANEKSALESFLLAFPSGVTRAVGFARTVTAANFQSTAVVNDLNLLIAEASKVIPTCDLIVKGYLDNRQVGFIYNTTNKNFDRDRAGLNAMTLQNIGTALSNQQGSVLTFMGVPVGTGQRMGVDRDGDLVLDGDEGLLHYGIPTPACATVIRIDGNSSPAVGNGQFAVVVEGAPANSVGWLLLSAKRANTGIADLLLLVDMNVGLLLPIKVDARGCLAFGVGIPNDSKLIGVKADLQSAMNAPCGVLGAAASSGLELTIVK